MSYEDKLYEGGGSEEGEREGAFQTVVVLGDLLAESLLSGVKSGLGWLCIYVPARGRRKGRTRWKHASSAGLLVKGSMTKNTQTK